MGITGMSQTNKNKAEGVLIPDYNLLDAGAFVFTQYQKDKLTVSGGIRFDNRHVNGKQMMDGADIKFEGFTKNFSNVSGSAGLSYLATKELTLKFNIARGSGRQAWRNWRVMVRMKEQTGMKSVIII